jgi:hypothetical protein
MIQTNRRNAYGKAHLHFPADHSISGPAELQVSSKYTPLKKASGGDATIQIQRLRERTTLPQS